MRSKFVLLIALLVLSSVPAAEGMEFTVQYNGGNCGSCTWVLSEGVVSSGTTEKFKAFVAKEKPPNNLVFDSPGGNVLEALKLGQFLRQSNWTLSLANRIQ